MHGLFRFLVEHVGTIGTQEQTSPIPLNGRDLSTQAVSCALEVSHQTTSTPEMDVAQSVTCVTQSEPESPSFKSNKTFQISRSTYMKAS
jgi:hypothetical protein